MGGQRMLCMSSTIPYPKQVMKMGGRELLWYQAPPAIHAALLRGTTADEDGNISFEDEAFYADSLNQVRQPFGADSQGLLALQG